MVWCENERAIDRLICVRVCLCVCVLCRDQLKSSKPQPHRPVLLVLHSIACAQITMHVASIGCELCAAGASLQVAFDTAKQSIDAGDSALAASKSSTDANVQHAIASAENERITTNDIRSEVVLSLSRIEWPNRADSDWLIRQTEPQSWFDRAAGIRMRLARSYQLLFLHRISEAVCTASNLRSSLYHFVKPTELYVWGWEETVGMVCVADSVAPGFVIGWRFRQRIEI